MAFSVKVIADSIGPSGKRITTWEATYWRGIHSEILTHRMLSRSSASSRAIPVEKMIQRVLDDPFIPEHIGKNQKGMQAEEQLPERARVAAVDTWLRARDAAVEHARHMLELGVHKQIANRLLEPWMWITVIITATELNNFYALRCHPAAEPHFQQLAYGMRDTQRASTPVPLVAGSWHRPYIDYVEDYAAVIGLERDGAQRTDAEKVHDVVAAGELLNKISVGRCARVSYLTHDGRRDIREDIALHDRLVVQEPRHAAPGEHVAQALATDERCANLFGWRSYRMRLPRESVPG